MPSKRAKSIAKVLQIVLAIVLAALLSLLVGVLRGNDTFLSWLKSQRWYSLGSLIGAVITVVIAMIFVALWKEFTPKDSGHHDLISGGQPEPPEDLTAYRRFLIEKKCNALQLAVMHTSAQELDRKVQLWSIFVPQSARESAPIPDIPPEIQRKMREEGHLARLQDEDELAEYRKRYESSPVRPIFEILDRNRLVVVVGDPGSGKTSLLKYRALQWARGKDDAGPLPLLVELSSYARDEGRGGFLEYFQSGVEVPRFDVGHLVKRLNEGRAAFYLDGLDEIFDPPTRKSVMNEIVALCASYPLAPIVVTTRKVGYDPERLRGAGFLHATLEEFDTPQIREFLDRWHLAAENDAALRDRLSKRIADAIGQSRAIRELAGNPLLLTMMAILNRNQELPRDRVKLYEQASLVLLREWDWTRHLFAVDAEKIAWQDKARLLRILAGEMQQTERGLAGNLIERDRLVSVFRVFLKELGTADPYSTSMALVQELTERSFILAYAGGERFCFVHRTFLEYFCAAWFVERMDSMEGRPEHLGFAQLRKEVFGRHWRDGTWHEVLRLIAGMVHATKAGELIRFLMGQDGSNDKLANLMLAAGCLSEVNNRAAIGAIAQELWERFQRQAIRFDPPYSYESWQEDEECGPTRQAAVHWMALAWKGESTRNWLRSAAKEDPDSIVRQAAVRELARGWKDDADTLPLLKDRARNDVDGDVRQAAVQELARGWKDDADTLPLLKDHARNDESGAVRQAAVQELARGWKDDADTLPLLEDYARNDESWDVRQAAVQELARGWKDDTGTLPLLKDRARNDVSGDLRGAAVRELARGWKDDADTLPWLKDRTRNDESWDVRQAALEELARGWKDDADTLPLLKDRARNDEDLTVRWTAVTELARGWKDDAGTLPLLKDRARNDEESLVRQAALWELARGWKDDADTLPLLKDRARNDENEYDRQTAVEELTRGWRDDAEVVQWIRKLKEEGRA